jgi:telomerase protein component 1
MKLPSIVTWERELSQKNNDKAWDKMLKENSLPYMAMLRNLRNIISGYLSPKAF